jgi:hypothetical protein
MLSHSLQNHQTLPFTAAAPLPLHRCYLPLPFTAVINLCRLPLQKCLIIYFVDASSSSHRIIASSHHRIIASIIASSHRRIVASSASSHRRIVITAQKNPAQQSRTTIPHNNPALARTPARQHAGAGEANDPARPSRPLIPFVPKSVKRGW